MQTQRNHHGRGNRSGRSGRVVALAGLLGLVIPATGAHAFAGTMAIPNFTPVGAGGTISGYTGWANSVAKTTAIVQAAGKTMAVEVAMTRAATAGRVIAGACWVNPLACAGVGMAAWMAVSLIHTCTEPGGWCKTVEVPIPLGYRFGSEPEKSWGLFADGSAGCIRFAAEHDWGQSAINGVLHDRYATFVSGQLVFLAGNKYKCVMDVWNADGTAYLTGKIEYMAEIENGTGFEDQPATEGDLINHGTVNPPSDAATDESPVPVPVGVPEVTPHVEPDGDTYPGDDTPEVGPWKQDRIGVKGKPETENPQDVEITPDSVPVDNPNTPEIEGEDPTDPDTKPEEKPFDLCEIHPNSVMCTDLGAAPGDEVPKRAEGIEYAEESLGLPSGCPADIPVGNHGVLSFSTACGIASDIRYLVVALGAFIASLIVVAAVRKG